jgi:hypothetical protein
MANEIQSSCTLRVTNGHLKSNLNTGTVNITQAVAKGPSPGTVNVGTSEEVISFAELTTLGVVQIINLDTTNFVQFGPEATGAMVAAIRLKPGEPNQFRLEPGVTYRAKADTQACNVQFMAFNN